MDMTERLVAELAALKARVANLERLEKSSFAAHAPMTLDANSVQVNSLTAQELGLQVQAHNFAWIGPESGAPVIPTFRLLVTGDIPIDSDTYNAAATAVVGTDADGGVRLDHAEFGSATGAGPGEVKTSGGLTVGAATGSVRTNSIGKYLGAISVAKSSRGRIIMNLASGFYLAVGNAQNGYSYTAAWIHVAGAAGTINVTECTAQMTFSFTDDDLYIDNTSSDYDNFFIYSVIKFA